MKNQTIETSLVYNKICDTAPNYIKNDNIVWNKL